MDEMLARITPQSATNCLKNLMKLVISWSKLKSVKYLHELVCKLAPNWPKYWHDPVKHEIENESIAKIKLLFSST